MSTQGHSVPPEDVLMQLLAGGKVALAVGCVTRLGIPDLVHGGPRSAEDLAGHIGAHAGALYRLMRMTASVGVLSEGADGRFAETPMSDMLRRDAPRSLRAWAVMCSESWVVRGWENLEHSVRTGETVMEKVTGKPAFEFFGSSPEAGAIFNDAMTSLSAMESPAIASAYAFEGIRTVCDVAGGHGLLLATILQRHAHLTGTLYDLPGVVKGVPEGPLKPVLSRCTTASGDMFESVPQGLDAYIMKHIIHDWPDHLCVKILKGCRQGINPGGKLLVADFVIPPGNDCVSGKVLDLEMLLFPGGMERTEKQFRDLFAAAGWRLSRVIPTTAEISIVEGVPA